MTFRNDRDGGGEYPFSGTGSGGKQKTQDDAAAAIAASAENRDALRIYADRLRAEAAKEQCAESVLTDETVLYFQGWVPAEQEKAVGAFLTEKGCAWETLDPRRRKSPTCRCS